MCREGGHCLKNASPQVSTRPLACSCRRPHQQFTWPVYQSVLHRIRSKYADTGRRGCASGARRHGWDAAPSTARAPHFRGWPATPAAAVLAASPVQGTSDGDAHREHHGLPPGAVPGAVVHVLPEEDDDMTLPVNLLSGAIAGMVADTTMHPFETLSTRAKVHPQAAYSEKGLLSAARLILAEEGLRGLLAGASVTAAVAAPCTAVYFGVYETVKRAGLVRLCDPARGGDERLEPVVFFVAGATSELGSSLLFLPSEVVKSRLQLGSNPARATGGRVALAANHGGPMEVARSIVSEQGVRGLFAGWRACLLQDCVFSAIQFLVYEEYCLIYRRAHGGRDMRPEETVLAGATAGGVGALLTNPLDLITTRLMTQGVDARFGSGIRACLHHAMTEGPRSLWRGSLARVLAVAPLSAITFTVYEAAKRRLSAWVDERDRRS